MDILQNNNPLNGENIIILSVDSEKLYPDSGIHIYGGPIEKDDDKTDLNLIQRSKIGSSELFARFINEIIHNRQIRIVPLDMKTQTYLVILLLLITSILIIKEKQSWASIIGTLALIFLVVYTWFQLNHLAKITIPLLLLFSVTSMIVISVIYTSIRAWLDNTHISKITKTCKSLLELSESSKSINTIIENHLIKKFKQLEYSHNVIFEKQYEYAQNGQYSAIKTINEAERLSFLEKFRTKPNLQSQKQNN